MVMDFQSATIDDPKVLWPREKVMGLTSITKAVLGEFRRLTGNKKSDSDVMEAFENSFETAIEFEDIPINLKRRIDEKLFYSEGPEVTVPADEFTFDY